MENNAWKIFKACVCEFYVCIYHFQSVNAFFPFCMHTRSIMMYMYDAHVQCTHMHVCSGNV